MIPAVFARHTIEVQNPTYVEEHGTRYPVFNDGDPWTPIPNVYIENGDTSEDHDRADAQIADWTVYGDLGIVDGDARIRFEFGGRQHVARVIGRPKYHDAGFGLNHHAARLETREG